MSNGIRHKKPNKAAIVSYFHIKNKNKIKIFFFYFYKTRTTST